MDTCKSLDLTYFRQIYFFVLWHILHLQNNTLKEFMVPAILMTTLAGGFLVTNYHDAGRKVSKSSLDRRRKQKRPLRQTAVDAWGG